MAELGQTSADSIISAVARVIAARPGEDFFAAIVDGLRDAAGAVGVALFVQDTSSQGLVTAAVSPPDHGWPESIAVEDPPGDRLLSSEPSFCDADDPEFGSFPIPSGGRIGLFPVIDAYGQPAGCIAIAWSGREAQEGRAEEIVGMVAPRIAQELERRDAEEMMLHVSEEVDWFSTALKEIHRLTSTNVADRSELLNEYLAAGAVVFGTEAGLITETDPAGQLVVESQLGTQIEIGSALVPDEIPCGHTRDRGRTTILSTGDELLSDRRCFAVPGDGATYIGTPLRAGEDIVGVMAFFSQVPPPNPFGETHMEILELMGSNLSTELERRRAEDEVRRLKVQQDGDYFLTSLLLHPLSGNFAEATTVSSDMRLLQKKQFRFRRWQQDLGGDLCVTHRIILQGRPHTVFLNADAMGKSMQGAGGALVLGSVFAAIIKRTVTSVDLSRYYPERWLRTVFQELENVFLTFDGSMLISVVLGVVDDQNGTLFFLNADHPWPVLLRDGRADFLHAAVHLPKIGLEHAQSHVRPTVFRLLPGDVLICGSDGRDDLLLGTTDRRRVLNEDEGLFLKVVQQNQGDLQRIESQLKEIGELTDDLSLLRIEYLGQPDLEGDALARDLRTRIAAGWRARSYAEAARLARTYMLHRPDDTEALYVLGQCARFLRRFEEAADMGERVRLRWPAHTANTAGLINSHIMLGNQGRAKLLLAELARHPNADGILSRLRALFEKRSTRVSVPEDLAARSN